MIRIMFVTIAALPVAMPAVAGVVSAQSSSRPADPPPGR